MALHDAPHGRQAHAVAREVVGAVQTLEEAEQAVGRAHIKTGAVVAHHHRGRFTVRHLAQRYLRHRAAAAVLPGVAQQVFQHQAQQRGVAPSRQAGFDVDVGRPFRRAAAQVVHHIARQLGQVDALPGQRLLRQPRQRQQRVDHQVHARCSAQHPVEVVVADTVQQAAVVFLDDAREPFDDADRRAQVMRQREGGGVAFARMGLRAGALFTQARQQQRLRPRQRGGRWHRHAQRADAPALHIGCFHGLNSRRHGARQLGQGAGQPTAHRQLRPQRLGGGVELLNLPAVGRHQGQHAGQRVGGQDRRQRMVCQPQRVVFIRGPGAAHKAGKAALIVAARHAAQGPAEAASLAGGGAQTQIPEGLAAAQAVQQPGVGRCRVEQRAVRGWWLARFAPGQQAVLCVCLPRNAAAQLLGLAQCFSCSAQCALVLRPGAQGAEAVGQAGHQGAGQRQCQCHEKPAGGADLADAANATDGLATHITATRQQGHRGCTGPAESSVRAGGARIGHLKNCTDRLWTVCGPSAGRTLAGHWSDPPCWIFLKFKRVGPKKRGQAQGASRQPADPRPPLLSSAEHAFPAESARPACSGRQPRRRRLGTLARTGPRWPPRRRHTGVDGF